MTPRRRDNVIWTFLLCFLIGVGIHTGQQQQRLIAANLALQDQVREQSSRIDALLVENARLTNLPPVVVFEPCGPQKTYEGTRVTPVFPRESQFPGVAR